MAREPQEWGGEVHLPNWLGRLLRRPPDIGDSAERNHEGPESPPRSGRRNVDRIDDLSEMYHAREGRRNRQK
jgi:hypothetical protein